MRLRPSAVAARSLLALALSSCATYRPGQVELCLAAPKEGRAAAAPAPGFPWAARRAVYSEVRRKLERLEQISLRDSAADKDRELAWARAGLRRDRLRALMDGLMAPLQDDLLAAGIVAESHPQAAPRSAAPWRSGLASLEPASGCAVAELALAFTIWQLDTLRPTLDERDAEVPGVGGQAAAALKRDRERARQALRYSELPPGLSDLCGDLAERLVVRRAFVLAPLPRDRRPLGFAMQMCGRPEAAHFADLSETAIGVATRELTLGHAQLGSAGGGDPWLAAWYREVQAAIAVAPGEAERRLAGRPVDACPARGAAEAVAARSLEEPELPWWRWSSASRD